MTLSEDVETTSPAKRHPLVGPDQVPERRLLRGRPALRRGFDSALGGAVFVASSVIHMVLSSWHKTDFKKAPTKIDSGRWSVRCTATG
jgi:hypothetical protein